MSDQCIPSGTGGPELLLSLIVGHAHIVIQLMASADSTALLPPDRFAFFKGIDFGGGESGVLIYLTTTDHTPLQSMAFQVLTSEVVLPPALIGSALSCVSDTLTVERIAC